MEYRSEDDSGEQYDDIKPNQEEQVKHESEFRVLYVHPAPPPLLLFLSVARVQGYSFSMAATERGPPAEELAP